MHILSILVITFLAGYPDCNMAELRQLYECAPLNKIKTQELLSCSKACLDNNTVKGYYGAGKIIMAKHYVNPISKLNAFKEGKGILEAAITADYRSAELRFLRISIQSNLPSYLGYKLNIEEDKQYLKECLPFIQESQLKSIIKHYLQTL
jgi:hypothetical protein